MFALFIYTGSYAHILTPFIYVHIYRYIVKITLLSIYGRYGDIKQREKNVYFVTIIMDIAMHILLTVKINFKTPKNSHFLVAAKLPVFSNSSFCP
jgi:Kef-type K+ transport system membrane component KefB